MTEINGFVEWLHQTVAKTAQITEDSREIQSGDVFMAFPGSLTDGRKYVESAVEKGAGAIIWESGNYVWNNAFAIPNLPVESLRRKAGAIAAGWYNNPSSKMPVIAVTGTNGKTSVTQWIARASELSGCPAAVVGTLGSGRPGHMAAGTLTTPDPVALQRTLAAFVKDGVKLTAMEASSIGIAEGRMDDVTLDTAVLTNITRDHLDYHKTMPAYKDAKFKLFEWKGLKTAVINLDDPLGEELIAVLFDKGRKVVGYTLDAVRAKGRPYPVVYAENLRQTAAGIQLALYWQEACETVDLSVIGQFNASNMLAVAGVLLTQGYPLNAVANVLPQLKPLPGRLQRAGNSDAEPLVLIDYAHTPDALENALKALRTVADARNGKLWCVFGCGGNRDHGKRPQMGKIAAILADNAIITTDNPRFEDPAGIIEQIAEGVPSDKTVQTISNRGEAIYQAVLNAKPNDVVLIAGKGHEPYQEIQGVKHPFSDLDTADKALQERQ